MRVLLIGNVANNSYWAAKLLRDRGHEADVLSYGSYHVMSSPEWEEADFQTAPTDHHRPDWSAAGLGSYERPRWFAQGPIGPAAAYLGAWRDGDAALAEERWRALSRARHLDMHPEDAPPPRPAPRPTLLRRARRVAGRVKRRLLEATRRPSPLESRALELVGEFERCFPSRADRLSLEDLRPYFSLIEAVRPLLPRYDVVHAGATDPMVPMLAGFHPYAAFEHGTLRDSPHVAFEFKGPGYPNAIGRLTALSYALADHVFITNADCRASAERLGITLYTGVPHPFDDRAFRAPEAETRALRAAQDVDHLFFCPIRHDWQEKGTDRYLRALPALRERLGGRIRAVFARWGGEVARSEALAAELGVSELVHWIEPLGRVSLARWLGAADVIWDQLAYASLSGLGPRALAARVPVIGAYEHAGLAWMFAEPAPIIAARSIEDVVERTVEATAPGFREAFAERARAWVERHHSGDVAAEALLDGYRRAIAHHGRARR